MDLEHNEIRKDMVTGDWVIIAPVRAKRPMDKGPKEAQVSGAPATTCPFDDLEATGNWPPILSYPQEENWEAVVLPNKYPAVTHTPQCAVGEMEGPYEKMKAIGHHDLVVLKDHDRELRSLTHEEAVRILKLLQDRYFMYAADPCIVYASAFQNKGKAAGASLAHPHLQILALPFVPPRVSRSLESSHQYFSRHKSCAHCASLRYEIAQKERIVDENEYAVAYAPYASKRACEVRILPKMHYAYFEQAPLEVIAGVASLLQGLLSSMKKNLGDPDYNLYVHSAPLKDQQKYDYYHWHIEVVPTVSVIAGMELSTGVHINSVPPESAARTLRGDAARHLRP